jgi:hypothetical protein
LFIIVIYFVHFRDLLDGKMFHIFVRDATDAVHVFLMTDSAWVGMPICVFEPEFEFMVGGIPALSTEQPLLSNQDLGDVVSLYQREWVYVIVETMIVPDDLQSFTKSVVADDEERILMTAEKSPITQEGYCLARDYLLLQKPGKG